MSFLHWHFMHSCCQETSVKNERKGRKKPKVRDVRHSDCYLTNKTVVFQGELRPDIALKNLTIFEGKFNRLKEERDNVARAKEALELAEPGNVHYFVNL